MVHGLVERGLLHIGPEVVMGGRRALFTSLGLDTLRHLPQDRRALNPDQFAHLHEELARAGHEHGWHSGAGVDGDAEPRGPHPERRSWSMSTPRHPGGTLRLPSRPQPQLPASPAAGSATMPPAKVASALPDLAENAVRKQANMQRERERQRAAVFRRHQ